MKLAAAAAIGFGCVLSMAMGMTETEGPPHEGAEAMAFDGSCACEKYLWIANKFSDTLTKLRTSDGTKARTVRVGRRPSAVLFDLTTVWVTNLLDDTVMRIDPIQGTVLSTAPVGKGPGALAFDGAHVWVSNPGGNSVSVFGEGEPPRARVFSLS